MTNPANKVVFDDGDILQVKKLSPFLTVAQLADYFEIAERTLRKVMERQPEVRAAYQKGRSEAIGAIAQSLVKKARDGNLTAMIFYLKTQARWSETQRIEHDAANGEGTITVSFSPRDSGGD